MCGLVTVFSYEFFLNFYRPLKFKSILRYITSKSLSRPLDFCIVLILTRYALTQHYHHHDLYLHHLSPNASRSPDLLLLYL